MYVAHMQQDVVRHTVYHVVVHKQHDAGRQLTCMIAQFEYHKSLMYQCVLMQVSCLYTSCCCVL